MKKIGLFVKKFHGKPYFFTEVSDIDIDIV